MLKGKTELILRIGLAFAFLYPAVSGFFNPEAWIGYFPVFILDVVPNELVLLYGFGIIEIIIGLWILSGKYIFYPSAAAALLLAAIVLFNINQMDVLFRDVSILAMAIALLSTNLPKSRSNSASDTPV